MASYSTYGPSDDELAMLLMAPELSPSQPYDVVSPILPYLPEIPGHGTYRRRSHTTIGMLLGVDDDAMRCRYPSKLCRNTRVRKASGALHRYCVYHRDKANANQKRWVDRQRESTGSASPTASTSSVSSPTSTESTAVYTQAKYRWIVSRPSNEHPEQQKAEEETRKRHKTPADAGVLSDDDWEALLVLLHPPKPSSRTIARCDQQVHPRRRAVSTPMAPTFAAKGAVLDPLLSYSLLPSDP